MARTVPQIISSLDAEQANHPDLVTNLNSTSQTAIYRLWKYVTAVCSNLLEQLWDFYKVDLENQISSAAPGTDYWVQRKVFEFQYDATTPQIVVINPTTFAVGYSVIDITKRIITRASVKTSASKTATVKVAKSEPPVPLSGSELSALKTYLSNGGNGTVAGIGIGFAGVYMNVISVTSDKLYLQATIKYDGQYSAVIQTNVIAALNNYLANIEFDGIVKIISIVDAIQSVQGVTDVQIVNCAIRAYATPLSSATNLILASTQLLTAYQTFAGYIIQETTTGNTFTDKLTFTPNS